jgi:hypothetical protein
MTIQERIEDIVKRSGHSEEVVRSVLKAEAESTAASIRNGENAVMPFIGKARPIFRRKVNKTGETKSVLDVRIDPLHSYSDRFEDIENFKGDMYDEESIAGIRCVQIEALM